MGMGKSLYEHYEPIRDIFLQIDHILGFSLSGKCFQGPEEELKDTSLQQLSILAVSLAAFEVFKAKNVVIDYLSGLSLGEYSCLYAGEVLGLDDLVVLVKERGLAMERASKLNSSAMLAVMGLEKDCLDKLGKKHNFYLANFNSPGQVVISLASKDKLEIKQILEAQEGVRVVELSVSGGFHSPFMEPAREHLEKIINNLEFKDAKVPIVSNYTAQPHTGVAEIKKNLINQLISPVLWKDCVEHMVAAGVETFFEIGPSKILRGLIRKIAPEAKVINIEKKEDLDKLLALSC